MPTDPDIARTAQHFEELALAIDAHAALPLNDQLTSSWILGTSDDAAQARALGEYWWVHLTAGCLHLLDRNALANLAPWMHHPLRFSECIAGLQHVLDHLITLAGAPLVDIRDGMTLARGLGRSVSKRQACCGGVGTRGTIST